MKPTAKSSILPDTCAWIDFFRGLDTPLCSGLQRALTEGAVLTCGVVQYELLQGVKVSQEADAILAAFEAVPFLETSIDVWQTAARLAAQLRSKGHSIPLSDILIATLAIKHDATILTVDTHFSVVPGVEVAATLD